MDAHAEPGLSIVVPIHNEEECIAELGRRLTKVADGLPETAEFVLVDDGSTDDSPALIRELAARDPRFRFLQLSRSFGHQIALTAGLEAARGRAVVTMDGDLQHPPEYIPEFLARWRGTTSSDGVMQERVVPTRFKSWSAKVFYRILRVDDRRHGAPAEETFASSTAGSSTSSCVSASITAISAGCSPGSATARSASTTRARPASGARASTRCG